MNSFIVKDIPVGSFFSKAVFLGGNEFILAAPEMPFSKELVKALMEWEFREVYSEGIPRQEYYSEDADGGELEAIDTASLSDSDQIKRAEDFYNSFTAYTESLFTKIAMNNEITFKEVAEKIKGVCEIIREDRRFLLRVQKKEGPETGQNYLSAHAVNSTITSIIIGNYLKLPNHRLIELGVAALLHEIGMIKLPPQIYLNKRPLSPQEKKAILTHPVLSYNTLKTFDFPLTICVAVLEHHERENGEGYPQKLTGDKISLYAKIIAVACSYEAVSPDRSI